MEYTLTLLPESKQVKATHGERLLDVLIREGYYLPAACGGHGTCGKCKVRIQGKAQPVLACRTYVDAPLTLELSPLCIPVKQKECTDISAERSACAVLDIGTTTLALRMLDAKTHTPFAEYTALNPQGVYGADVLSRIQAFGEGHGEDLQGLLLKEIREMLVRATHEHGIRATSLTVAANPTMLHLLLKVDPTAIGTYPFTPVFKDTQRRTGKELSLPVEAVTLLPSSDAYIGSDITAGVLYCSMHTTKKTELFVDIGTNGEIVLAHKGKLYAASCAAGPALEGACIACGMGGVSGGVSCVGIKEQDLSLETVENASPLGICGSGLIDLIALLLREGLIDESGAFDPDTESVLANRLSGDRFFLTDQIYLSQNDIRQYQLAKSAISAGITTLLSEQGLTVSDVDTVYIAGGLGFYMNVDHAIATGLLPPFRKEKIRTVGNTSLLGASLCADSEEMLKTLEDTAARVSIIELSFSEAFSNAYMEGMLFS